MIAMISNSLRQFQASINNLKEYVRVSLKQEQNINILSDDRDLIQSSLILSELIENEPILRSLRKNIDYSASVILLYGALERYIEDVAVEYLRYLSSFVNVYQELPDKIKNNHLQKSLDLINSLKLEKYEHLNQEEIIKNLYLCQSSESSYQLNFEAYTQHTANFRNENINLFFSGVRDSKH